jgi:hypothetical protein
MPASVKQAGNEQHAESTEVTLARDTKTESFGTKAYKIPQKTDWRSTFFGSKSKKRTERVSRKRPYRNPLVFEFKLDANPQYRYSKFSMSDRMKTTPEQTQRHLKH